jgi:acyl carrier protein
MTEEELKQTLLKMLKTIAPDTEPERLQPDDNIRTTLEIDSFDYLQFIVGIDEKLGIETPEEDYGKISTLRSLIDYLMVKMQHSST